VASFAGGEPLNLTAAVDRLPWPEVGQALRIRARCAEALLEIHGVGPENAAAPEAADRVYVVVSGYGVLRWGEGSTEFTGGDLLFVPGGCPHRIEGQGGEIRLWRIALLPAASGGGTEAAHHPWGRAAEPPIFPP
jgi:mannose-6-phosphate isomerase-like protein (cupin superfamily)